MCNTVVESKNEFQRHIINLQHPKCSFGGTPVLHSCLFPPKGSRRRHRAENKPRCRLSRQICTIRRISAAAAEGRPLAPVVPRPPWCTNFTPVSIALGLRRQEVRNRRRGRTPSSRGRRVAANSLRQLQRRDFSRSTGDPFPRNNGMLLPEAVGVPGGGGRKGGSPCRTPRGPRAPRR